MKRMYIFGMVQRTMSMRAVSQVVSVEDVLSLHVRNDIHGPEYGTER